MTYSINGVVLDNPTLGWSVVRDSIPVMGFERDNPVGESTGKDGVRPLPSVRKDSTIQLLIRHKDAYRSDLFSLMTEPKLVFTDSERPGWFAEGRLMTSSPEKFYGHKDWGVDLFVINIPGGCWRKAVETTAIKLAAPAGATLDVFPGLSAPVQDAIVRLKGPLQNPQVLDSSGAFIAVAGTIAAGEYLRFEAKTGRAWLTTSDIWTGGTEVSGEVDSGGPRYNFEITPLRTNPADPLARVGRLTLTQTTYNTGSGFQVRGAAVALF